MNNPVLSHLGKETEKSKIHIYFDDDGVLHKWNHISVDIPAEYMDKTEEERSKYISDEVYKVLLSDNYFKNLPVQQSMVDLAKALFDLGYDVQVLSCSINADTSRQKMASLKECMPWLPVEKIILLPDGLGKEKYKYIPEEILTDNHLLIDDHTPNCTAFTQGLPEQHMDAIKCRNDVNGKNGTWRGECVSTTNTLRENLSVVESVVTRLQKGKTLSWEEIRTSWEISKRVIQQAEDSVRTLILTDLGLDLNQETFPNYTLETYINEHKDVISFDKDGNLISNDFLRSVGYEPPGLSEREEEKEL